MKLHYVVGLCALTHCAEPPAARPPSRAVSPELTDAGSTASPGLPPPAPSPVARDAAVPPLSTPNPLATAKIDAGEDTQAPASDPRTAAVRRIALGAQDCHARHAPGIKGRLTLRILPDHTGAVKSVSVVRAQTSAELARPAFETCVLEAAKKERLSPARDEDDEVELPITFEPTP